MQYFILNFTMETAQNVNGRDLGVNLGPRSNKKLPETLNS
jgi:hypothetical protein